MNIKTGKADSGCINACYTLINDQLNIYGSVWDYDTLLKCGESDNWINLSELGIDRESINDSYSGGLFVIQLDNSKQVNGIIDVRDEGDGTICLTFITKQKNIEQLTDNVTNSWFDVKICL